MAKHKEWFQVGGNTDLLTPVGATEVTITGVDFLPTNHTLIRTLFWADIRFLVPEDFTGVPRTPVPIMVTATWTNGDLTPVAPPGDPAPTLRTLLWADASAAVGTIDPMAEIHYRAWTGHTGAQPVDSSAERSGAHYAFVGQMSLGLEPCYISSSDIGFWSLDQYVVFYRMAFLHLVDDSL